MAKADQSFVSVREAMDILRVSKPTVYNLIARGKLKKYHREIGTGRGGTRTFLKRSEVETLKVSVIEVK